MWKDFFPLVLQAFIWDLWGFPSNTWQYKNRTWEGEFVFLISVCPKNINHAQKMFKRILVAFVIIFHSSFFGIIGNEPSGKYKDPTHDLFHQKTISFFAEKNQWRPFTDVKMKSFEVLIKIIGWWSCKSWPRLFKKVCW